MFETAIIGDYRVIDRQGGIAGTLDGMNVDGRRLLGAGARRFVADAPAEILYMPAVTSQRGLAPAAAFGAEALYKEASAGRLVAYDMPMAGEAAVANRHACSSFLHLWRKET